MKFTRWQIKPGLKVHLKTPAGFRYLCGKRTGSGHQQVWVRLNMCERCEQIRKRYEKRGY